MTVHKVNAQTGRMYKQPAHTFAKDMTWWDSIYLYPNFREGNIAYFTGFAPERNLRLNYNLYFGQIDMIDARGDTVQIVPSKTFGSALVGDDLFLYDQKEGYLRAMVPGDLTLAERIFFQLAKADYVSGGQTTGGVNPDYDVRGRPSNYDRSFVQTSFYYFVDKQGKFFKANPAALKKLFPEYKSSIKEFINSRAIDFSKEADLREVTHFCNHLGKTVIEQ